MEVLYDGESLGYLQQEPYKKTINVGESSGKKFVTIQAWDVHNNMSKKSIPIFVQKNIHYADKNPEITTIKALREAISATVVIPNPDKVDWLELSASLDGENIFAEKINNPEIKTRIFSIPKSGHGLMKINLQVKNKDSRRLENSGKEIKF